MSGQSSSCELLKLANNVCPILAQLGHKAILMNYWKKLGKNLALKFLWHITLCISFLKKFIALYLNMYRVSYALYNLVWLGLEAEI